MASSSNPPTHFTSYSADHEGNARLDWQRQNGAARCHRTHSRFVPPNTPRTFSYRRLCPARPAQELPDPKVAGSLPGHAIASRS